MPKCCAVEGRCSPAAHASHVCIRSKRLASYPRVRRPIKMAADCVLIRCLFVVALFFKGAVFHLLFILLLLYGVSADVMYGDVCVMHTALHASHYTLKY